MAFFTSKSGAGEVARKLPSDPHDYNLHATLQASLHLPRYNAAEMKIEKLCCFS
jgi:hypothetical protein